MHKWIVVSALIGFIFFDATINASRAITFASDNFTMIAFLAGAIVLAISPPVIAYFGDKRAIFISSVAATLSALLGSAAVINSFDMKADTSAQTLDRRAYLSQQLSDKDIKIANCRSDRYCISQDLREHYQALEAELTSMPNVQTINPEGWQHKLTLSIMALIAIMAPFVSSELSRQISVLNRSSTPKQGTKTVPAVPSLGTSETKRGTEKRMWDDKQHQKLEHAWKTLEKEGKKITLDNLQQESGVSRSLCSLYKRGGGPQALPIKGKLLEFPKKD